MVAKGALGKYTVSNKFSNGLKVLWLYGRRLSRLFMGAFIIVVSILASQTLSRTVLHTCDCVDCIHVDHGTSSRFATDGWMASL
jgi:hypothetical protein